MPNTSTATWPALTSGQKAKASDVEAKFDWSEHNIWPHSSGTKADGAYSLGDTDAAWLYTYTRAINPTGPANLVVGSTTAANSDVAFEIASQKAFVLPRISTATRDGLTAVNGMVIYNSTAGKLQVYEAGAWQNMGGVFGYREFGGTVDTSGSTVVFSTNTSGRFIGLKFAPLSSGRGINTMEILIDSTTVGSAITCADTSGVFWLKKSLTASAGSYFDATMDTAGSFGNTTTAEHSVDLSKIDLAFKTSLQINVVGQALGDNGSMTIYWEGV